MLCNDMDVVWKGNKELKFTLAPPGMCLSRLWVSGWVWIWENKTLKVSRFHMAYALAVSYRMSGMQFANIMVDHSALKTLWVHGNSVNAIWALNWLPLFFMWFFYVTFFFLLYCRWINNSRLCFFMLSIVVCALGLLGKQMIQLANKFYFRSRISVKSPTAKENPPNCPKSTLCSLGAKATILAMEICMFSIMETINTTVAITVHYIDFTAWIHTHLLPVFSCSNSLRMDFPSMSGGVSSPAMWRIVGARSMFSTKWGFLKKYMHRKCC